MTPRPRERAWTWFGAAALIGVVVAGFAAALAWTGFRADRVPAIAFAAGIALVGGLGGWLAGRQRTTEPARAVGANLAAVCLRFFPALAAVAWLHVAGGRLRENGATEWLLGFYLASLATDVLLNIIGLLGGRHGGTGREI